MHTTHEPPKHTPNESDKNKDTKAVVTMKGSHEQRPLREPTPEGTAWKRSDDMGKSDDTKMDAGPLRPSKEGDAPSISGEEDAVLDHHRYLKFTIGDDNLPHVTAGQFTDRRS
jgi:hypothetical protein